MVCFVCFEPSDPFQRTVRRRPPQPGRRPANTVSSMSSGLGGPELVVIVCVGLTCGILLLVVVCCCFSTKLRRYCVCEPSPTESGDTNCSCVGPQPDAAAEALLQLRRADRSGGGGGGGGGSWLDGRHTSGGGRTQHGSAAPSPRPSRPSAPPLPEARPAPRPSRPSAPPLPGRYQDPPPSYEEALRQGGGGGRSGGGGVQK